ncbi:MAG: HD domain-containing protein [Thermomicrobiales bacterium]
MLEKTPVTHPESRLGRTAGTGFPVSTMLRDSLYDIVPLADAELALIDAQAFLRLERVQQLGFVSRVWPGARHTRFEHSIGVFHLARQAIEHLRARSDAQWITDEDARTICAAALLHDIGHYPFSHAIEELGDPVISHEQVGRAIVLGDEIAPILREHWGVDPKRVASIIDPAGQQLHPADTVLRGILSGPLDVDKLDYLPRDAHACSVPYGGVDTNRLIASLILPRRRRKPNRASPSMQRGQPPPFPHQRPPGNVRQRLLAPHQPRVYGDVAARRAGRDLRRCHFGHRTDRQRRRVPACAHDPLPHARNDQAVGECAATARDPQAVRSRSAPRQPISTTASARSFHNPAQRRTVELGMTRRLETLLGESLPDETILIDIPKPERWRTDVWVWFERPPVGFRRLMPWREVVGLGDDDFKRFEEHRRLVRIIAAEPYRDAVRQHWEALLLPELGGVI